jgi:hypothetical protein
VGLERGPISLVSTIEELLGRKSSGSGLENREYGCTYPSCRPRGALYPQTLALTSPTSCGRSIDIVRSRTQGHGGFIFSGTTIPYHMCVYKYITACNDEHVKTGVMPCKRNGVPMPKQEKIVQSDTFVVTRDLFTLLL